MPQGKGTYGSQVGRPKINKGTTGPKGKTMKPKKDYFEMASEKPMKGMRGKK